ncbi:MAG: hypothetical protein JWQ96_1577 [Segetibacter sp.]|nr:hypothetical protein [Segetibacter sp.]
MVIGAPVVTSLKTPVIIFGISSSLRGVVPLVPPLRRSISVTKSAAFNCTPAGHPSIVTPTCGPCDSPKMLTLNIRPNELITSCLKN